MTYYIGIDGGGSNLRVGVFNADRTLLAEVDGETVNPSIIGREESARRIQAAIQSALHQANLTPAKIQAACAGVAGASNTHSQGWLEQVLHEALPAAVTVISSDYEIALVGAHEKREGVLLLAGTGSLAYGINHHGETALAGAWGYLIGDEGSGYWLGAQALRAAVRDSDGRGDSTALTPLLLKHLQLQRPLDLITWLYRSQTPRMRDVAALAPLVLDCATSGDAVAQAIIHEGAAELALAARAVLTRLQMQPTQIAFAGSLLRTLNPLSEAVCQHLHLSDLPLPRSSPLVGAALLAQATVK
ncbi:MAG: hypothetical protein K8L99_16295 [Anaerolineae bacterium]|nr:hypothetical protein [Anaerolineae bacterium]